MNRHSTSKEHEPDDDGFDDYPDTHLADDEYEAFLAREIDGRGGLRGPPPVTLILVILIIVVLAIAFTRLG